MTTHESNNRIPEIRTWLYAWKRNMNTYWKDLELSMMSINPSIMPLCIRQTTRVQNLCKKVNFQKLVNTFLWIVYSKIMVLRSSSSGNKILLYGVSWEHTFGRESLFMQKRLYWLCSSCDSWFTPIFHLLKWLVSFQLKQWVTSCIHHTEGPCLFGFF